MSRSGDFHTERRRGSDPRMAKAAAAEMSYSMDTNRRLTPHHVISAHVDGNQVGTLTWNSDSGEIGWVNVHPDYRGLGMASRMLHSATSEAASRRLVPPRHSEQLTADGEKWVAGLSEKGSA